MKYCQQCGAQLEEEMKFCVYCGASAEDSANAQQEQNPWNKLKQQSSVSGNVWPKSVWTERAKYELPE